MKRLLVILALALLVATGCRPTDPWALVVNGQEISSATVQDELRAVVADPAYANAINETLGGTDELNQLQRGGKNTVNADYTAQVISGRVIAVLVEQELRSRGLSVTAEARGRAEELFRQEYSPTAFDGLDPTYRSYLVDRVGGLLVLIEDQTSPGKLQAYYDTHRNEFSTSTCVRDIVVEREDIAASLRARIVAGEDFAEIARTESMSSLPSAEAASNNGDLGCLSSEELTSVVAPFHDALVSLPVNEVSQPLKSDSGFHLVEVTSRSTELVPFEQAQGQISKQLGDPQAYISSLIKDAKVEINPRYGEYTKSQAGDGGGSIQPHQPVMLRDSANDVVDSGNLPTGGLPDGE